ncbi:GTPase [Agathobacter sp.]
MNALTKKELKTIEKVCGCEYSSRLEAIQNKQNDSTVKIVNTGMVSSGKSSLYNILINSNQEEFFPTGAARTTKKAKYFDYKNISYIDTPGIDVRDEDDALAFDTIIKSDIILMIHNIRTGPLNRSEVDWLDRIVHGMSSLEMCLSRIVFVISWKDTREKDNDYSELVENLKKQVFEIVGGEIPVFEISAKKYLQGVDKEKQILIEKSGIIQFRTFLEEYADEYIQSKKKNDIQEYLHIVSDVEKMLNDVKGKKQKEKQEICTRNQNSIKAKSNIWNMVFNYFSLKRDNLDKLEKELEEELEEEKGPFPLFPKYIKR